MSRKRRKKRSRSANRVPGEVIVDDLFPAGWEPAGALGASTLPQLSGRAVRILSMIADGFTYNQIVNRMEVTPRHIFDAAEEALQMCAWHESNAACGGEAGDALVDAADIPF